MRVENRSVTGNNPVERQICGAKTRRSGLPCQTPPMKGKKRCRLHGGASDGAPKGNTNALKHGIYSDALLPGEEGLWDQLYGEIGKLDQEITLMRLRLHRLLRLQKTADAADMAGGSSNEALQLQSVQVQNASPHPLSGMAGKVTTVTKSRRDYSGEIRATAKAIADMEARRAAIKAGTGDGDPNKTARDIAEALQAIDDLQAGGTIRDDEAA